MYEESDLYKLERRIGHLERTLESHGQAGVMVAEKISHIASRSDERLEYIRERFDGIEEQLEADNARDRWIVSAGGTVVGALAMSIWFLWMEPLAVTVSELAERLDNVEERIIRAGDYHKP